MKVINICGPTCPRMVEVKMGVSFRDDYKGKIKISKTLLSKFLV